MFRMRSDADRWFRYIVEQAPVKTKFDVYYLCLMVGIKQGELDDVTDAIEIYQKFPQEYEGSRLQVLALLISAELKREGLEFNERDAVQSVIARYIATDSPSNLSAEGFKRANSYASGGFNLLVDAYGEPPQDVNAFLAKYAEFIGED